MEQIQSEPAACAARIPGWRFARRHCCRFTSNDSARRIRQIQLSNSLTLFA
jgi:hypothetical protein